MEEQSLHSLPKKKTICVSDSDLLQSTIVEGKTEEPTTISCGLTTSEMFACVFSCLAWQNYEDRFCLSICLSCMAGL